MLKPATHPLPDAHLRWPLPLHTRVRTHPNQTHETPHINTPSAHDVPQQSLTLCVMSTLVTSSSVPPAPLPLPHQHIISLPTTCNTRSPHTHHMSYHIPQHATHLLSNAQPGEFAEHAVGTALDVVERHVHNHRDAKGGVLVAQPAIESRNPLSWYTFLSAPSYLVTMRLGQSGDATC